MSTEKVEAFYGDKNNWSQVNAQRCSSFTAGDHEWFAEVPGFYAGASARSYMEKWK